VTGARPRTFLACLAALAGAGLGCHSYDYSPRHGPGQIDLFDDLFAVSVADEQHAVAVGYHGAVYYTEDGGKHWSKGTVPTNALLYGVSMADSRHGWAVGQLGTILRTEDGGRSWRLQPNLKIEEGSHLFGVQALDAQSAWAVGEWGTRIRTRDGGETWEDHSLLIDLLHPQYVWLSERDQEKVRNGEKVYDDVGLNSIFCLELPSQRCWTVGEFGYIFYSEDRGETWQRGEIASGFSIDPIPFGHNEIEIKGEHRAKLEEFAKAIAGESFLNVLIDPIASPKEIREFGRGGDPTELFDILSARMAEATSILEDAGLLSDRLRTPNKPPWDYEDFLEDDPGFLERYLTGRQGERSLLQIAVIQNPYLFTVSFRDEQTGLISGLGGVILRSQDGGRSWRYEATDRKQAVFAVGYAETRALAIGEKGLIRESLDGGSAWREPAPERFPTIFTYMRDMAFDRHRRIGFIVGQEGMVLRTEDGGGSWSWVLPPPDRRRA